MRFCVRFLLCMKLLLFTFKPGEGYYGQRYKQCYYNSDSNTIEFLYSWYFNKVEYLRYNSTSDNYMGFTDYGMTEAESLNQNHSNSRYYYIKVFCNATKDKVFDNVLKTVKPKLTVRSLRSKSDVHLPTLMCCAYDYFPKGATLWWLRDGEVVTEGVSSTDELSDGDWYYQIHSYLEYIPRPGENITCVVEHESLTRPLIYTWDPSPPVDDRNKLIIGIFLLVLGIALAVAGFLYYMLRSKECRAIQTPQAISLEPTGSETNSEASNP